jgi:hypothetical protein
MGKNRDPGSGINISDSQHCESISIGSNLFLNLLWLLDPRYRVKNPQCYGSGMFNPDPGSRFLPLPNPGSRIPDAKTATKERGEAQFVISFL